MRFTRGAARHSMGHIATTSAEPKVNFYTHTLCPYAQRVWLTLLKKEVPHKLVHIDLSNKPQSFYSINPRGLVPALEVDGHVVVESIDICRWIEDNLNGPALMPDDAALRKQADALINSCGSLVSSGLSMLAGNSRSWGIGSGQTRRDQQAFESQLQRLAQAIDKSGGPFLAGPDVSLADLVYMPFLERFALAMPVFCGYDPCTALDGQIGAWLAAMEALPACKAGAADPALLLGAYKKHRCLDFFDYATYEEKALHPHNQ